MNIIVKGRNIEITPALREYVEKRTARFDKLVEVDEAVAVLQVTKDSHRVEITLYISGMILRGEDESYDMYACIDAVAEKLDRQIERYKGRFSRKGRSSGFKEVAAEAIAEEPAGKIIRTKVFSAKPMSVDEAVLQMQLLQHAFFAFTNEQTGTINIVYCRKDGGYGLLEPEK